MQLSPPLQQSQGLLARLWRRAWRLLRWMLVGNAVLAGIILAGVVAFHCYASRSPENFEQVIGWSAKYILTPGIMVDDGDLPAEAVLPIARVIETILIRAVDLGPRHDAHKYWQGRLLQPMALTYGKLDRAGEHLDRGRRALRVFADLVARHPTHIEYRRRLARSHQMLGEELAAQRQYPVAQQHFHSALKVAEDLLRDEPGFWRWRWYEALALYEAGLSLAAQGMNADARAAWTRGHPLAVSLRSEFPADERWPALVAQIEQATAAFTSMSPQASALAGQR